MDIIDQLLQIDYRVFEAINHMQLPVLLDQILIYWRTPLFWAPFYTFVLSFFFFNFGKKGWLLLLFSLLVFGSADMMSSQLIKKSVQRVRPCRTEVGIEATVRVRCGSGYSFTSSHATNHFALATFWIFILGGHLRGFKTGLIVWASLVCLAQVYVGVHYPSDVIAGAILGGLIGLAWSKAVSKFPPLMKAKT